VLSLHSSPFDVRPIKQKSDGDAHFVYLERDQSLAHVAISVRGRRRAQTHTVRNAVPDGISVRRRSQDGDASFSE